MGGRQKEAADDTSRRPGRVVHYSRIGSGVNAWSACSQLDATRFIAGKREEATEFPTTINYRQTL
jgi:hypothetical protein